MTTAPAQVVPAPQQPSRSPGLVGLLEKIIDKYGNTAFGLVAFVVVVATIVVAIRALGPEFRALVELADKIKETTQLQLQLANALNSALTEVQAASGVLAKNIERVERAAERVERALERAPRGN